MKSVSIGARGFILHSHHVHALFDNFLQMSGQRIRIRDQVIDAVNVRNLGKGLLAYF